MPPSNLHALASTASLAHWENSLKGPSWAEEAMVTLQGCPGILKSSVGCPETGSWEARGDVGGSSSGSAAVWQGASEGASPPLS